MNANIAAERLTNQRLTRPGSDPAAIVEWLGAMQSQEYAAAKWAIGLRMRDGASDAGIEQACDDGRILRTHVMRPTWHFVAAADIHWMLKLTAGRVERAMAYANRYYGVDAASRTHATKLFEQALRDGQCLTRADLGAHLARRGVAAKGIALALLALHAELQGVLCSGPRRGRQSTYALLAARAPRARQLSRDEALGELTTRFFRSHGPATVRDFAWWSGLTVADVKRGLEIIRAHHEVIGDATYWRVGRATPRPVRRGLVHLLPVYDEYVVAYRDRDAVPHRTGVRSIFQPALVIDGQIAGSWKNTPKRDRVVFDFATPGKFIEANRRAIDEQVARYLKFLQAPAP